MKPIPTRPVWYVMGRDDVNENKTIDRYWTASDAESAFAELRNRSCGLSYSITESRAIIPDRTLPTKSQQVEIGLFLQRAFVILRTLSLHGDSFSPIAKLTDILHNLPEEMFDPARWDWNSYISALRDFRQEFPDVATLNLPEMLEDIRDRAEQVGDGKPDPALS